MNLSSFCEVILLSPEIEKKLTSPKKINWDDENNFENFKNFNKPVRHQNFSFNSKQIKFPNNNELMSDSSKALAFHFFANHELLAIELFTWAMTTFRSLSVAELKKISATIEDEQKHFKLYCNRMSDFGVTFGDYPVNDFFWKIVTRSTNPKEFYALMALTFEQANLDFSKYYRDLFYKMNDIKSAEILNTVYEEEITHVKRGVQYLQKDIGLDKLWDIYLSSLPEGTTPDRAKGKIFDRDSRKRAGLDSHYIDSLFNYNDDFRVTKRKEWSSIK